MLIKLSPAVWVNTANLVSIVAPDDGSDFLFVMTNDLTYSVPRDGRSLDEMVKPLEWKLGKFA